MTRILLLSLLALSLFSSVGSASTTWYVNGKAGSDGNSCTSATSACKTISHAIALSAAGDTVMVAAATYNENLNLSFDLKVIGSAANTTIVQGVSGTVVTVSNVNAHVNLSKLTITGGVASCGGGIYNIGTLVITKTVITGNRGDSPIYGGSGGGICNRGTLTINTSTIDNNTCNGPDVERFVYGAGIFNAGTLMIARSTISRNLARGFAIGGGITNSGTVNITNSTIASNDGSTRGGGITNLSGSLNIYNATIARNTESNYYARGPGGIDGVPTTIQNSILSRNTKGNCLRGVLYPSLGYNLSSDDSCTFGGPANINRTDPLLGALQNNGGPTETRALLPGSPAIDAGNPTGCTDGNGHLLTTDQRGFPRPAAGCDMGAYEVQN